MKVSEWLGECEGEYVFVLLTECAEILGGLEGFAALWVAYLGEAECGDSGCVEVDGHSYD